MAKIQVQTDTMEEDFKDAYYEVFDNGSLQVTDKHGETIKRYSSYISVSSIPLYDKHSIEYA